MNDLAVERRISRLRNKADHLNQTGNFRQAAEVEAQIADLEAELDAAETMSPTGDE